MPCISSDHEMQNQCKVLLQQLKTKQNMLNGLVFSTAEPPSNNYYDADLSSLKPVYAREKLKQAMKPIDTNDIPTACQRDRETANLKIYDSNPKPRSVTIQSRLDNEFKDNTEPKSLYVRHNPSYQFQRQAVVPRYQFPNEMDIPSYQSEHKGDGLDDLQARSYTTDDNMSRGRSVHYSATPKTMSRRQLIDRNVKVGFSDSELFCSDEPSNRLNFSYSHVDEELFPSGVSHDQHLQDSLAEEETDVKLVHHGELSNTEETSLKQCKDASEVLTTGENDKAYSKHLKDEGNNKRLNSLFKDSMKSSNLSSRNTSTISKYGNSRAFSSRREQRLMGYDWIAALLDNDTDLMDETETFFQDIKDFRRVNKDQCSNQFYMEGPLSLAINLDPSPVVSAISESRIKPYIVNDRLFTTPLKKCLLDDLGAVNDEEEKLTEKQRQPSFDQPRFVRVSIPRSSLETPTRIQPHRRSSFDASDSCALSEHCLLGWENSRPAMIPTASSVGLSDATGELKSRLTTTLAEAERMASSYSWPFPQLTTHKPDLFPSWRKEYHNTTLNLTAPSVNLTSGSGPLPDGSTIRKNTDNLLNSTYSMMFEMERLKKERDLNMQTSAVK